MQKSKASSKTIGPTSAEFIRSLKLDGKIIFSLEEAENYTKKNRNETSKFINPLIKRSIVARLNAGIYLLLETGQESTQLSNWPLIAKALAGDDEKYFLSHYAAMRLHGMTTHPLLEISITLTKRKRAKTINHISYQFIYCQTKNFWGIEKKWVSKNEKVNVSDIERTILDCLNRPNLCGGITEIIRGIWLKQNEINWEKLSSHAQKFQSKAAIKRLGYILETLEIGTSELEKIKKIIEPTKDYILFGLHGENEGRYIKRWRLRLNIPDIRKGL